MFSELRGKRMESPQEFDSEDSYLPCVDVDWATPMKPVDAQDSEVETAYMAWGNEPTMEFIYGTLCLIVQIPDKTGREKYLE